MNIETCIICDEATGRAGKYDDSLYDNNDIGPYCEACYNQVVDFNGDKVPYNGVLSDQSIKEMMSLRNSGMGIVNIGKIIGVDSSQVSRLCDRLKCYPEVKEENYE